MKLNKDFLNKFKNKEVVVKITNKNEWNEFLLWIEENSNLNWASGCKPTKWDGYRTEAIIGICVDSLSLIGGIGNRQLIEYKELKKTKNITLFDIKERWVVTFRNGKEAVKHGEHLRIIEKGTYNGEELRLYNYTENLTRVIGDREWDIAKVLKPRYEEIWTRTEEEKKEVKLEDIVKYYEENKNCKIIIKEN